MNALLSFKRNGKTDNTASPSAKAVDPLMDGKVMLDEIPEEHFSTLKFLDMKREEAAKQATDTPQAQVSPTVPTQERDITTPAKANAAVAKPSRMQLFKDRISIERQDAVTLPFASNAKASAVGKRIKLSALDAASSHISPIRSLLNNGFVLADNASASFTHISQSRTASADGQAQQQIQAQAQALANAALLNAALTAEHLQQAARNRFCLTRSHENLATVIGAYLCESDSNKALTLHFSDASQFDYCAGGADLFIKPVGLTTHRLTETDNSRSLTVDGASRQSIDSLTAAHPLRQRSMEDVAFNGWFTEDGLECDTGVSPIETFVQAELLHMQQQAQRTLVQMRRLSAHLQAQCPHLEPLEAMHHAAQADAWLAQHGQAASASLYRLLECTVTASLDGKGNGLLSVHEFFKHNPTRLPTFNTIAWPHVPAGLQLLQTLAALSQSTHADETGAMQISAYLIERLAVLDLLMRDPAQQTSRTAPISVDAASRENLLNNLRGRFANLATQMQASGLLQNTPHPEGKVRNTGKHA